MSPIAKTSFLACTLQQTGSRKNFYLVLWKNETSFWNFLIYKDDAEENEEDYDIPDEIEEVIEYLLEGLRSVETVIRWSAAKGQLISKCPFGVIITNKKFDKFLL